MSSRGTRLLASTTRLPPLNAQDIPSSAVRKPATSRAFSTSIRTSPDGRATASNYPTAARPTASTSSSPGRTTAPSWWMSPKTRQARQTGPRLLSDDWGIVNLGTIEGHLEQAVAEMDDLNPEIAPYGVAGAWRVKDSRRASDIVSLVLKKAYIQNDFYEFHRLEDVDAMTTAIARALSDRHQLVESVGATLADWGGVPSLGERNDGNLFDAEEDKHDVGMRP